MFLFTKMFKRNLKGLSVIRNRNKIHIFLFYYKYYYVCWNIIFYFLSTCHSFVSNISFVRIGLVWLSKGASLILQTFVVHDIPTTWNGT